MKYVKSFFPAFVFLISLSFQLFSQDRNPVPLPNSEVRIVHSEKMDQDFRIYVQFPLDYHPGNGKTYPVMYVTDGNRSFPIVANISTILGFPYTGFPQVIVIGIAYEIGGMLDWAVLRTRDLTPVNDEGTNKYWEGLLAEMTEDSAIEVNSGGAPLFLEFICDELVPLIESEYPVSQSDKALGGYSYGGLFTMFALFERPGFFDKYFAGSPSLDFADNYMFEMEETFAAGHSDLNANLFICAGGSEWKVTIENMKKMESRMNSRNYPNLEIHSHVFEGEDHKSAYPGSIMRAFKVLYAPDAGKKNVD